VGSQYYRELQQSLAEAIHDSVPSTRTAAVIDAAVETARPLVDAKRHTLRVEVPPQSPSLRADPLVWHELSPT
jgi:hypothetical protein